MKALIILAIFISALSLISVVGAIVALITMPDLREIIDSFLISSVLQLSTAIFVLFLATIWFKGQSFGNKYLIPILIFVLFNVVDAIHSLLAYSDFAYAVGVVFFRLIPLLILALTIPVNRQNNRKARQSLGHPQN